MLRSPWDMLRGLLFCGFGYMKFYDLMVFDISCSSFTISKYNDAKPFKNPEDMLRFLFLWHGICGSKISCFADISCDVGQVFLCFCSKFS